MRTHSLTTLFCTTFRSVFIVAIISIGIVTLKGVLGQQSASGGDGGATGSKSGNTNVSDYYSSAISQLKYVKFSQSKPMLALVSPEGDGNCSTPQALTAFTEMMMDGGVCWNVTVEQADKAMTQWASDYGCLKQYQIMKQTYYTSYYQLDQNHAYNIKNVDPEIQAYDDMFQKINADNTLTLCQKLMKAINVIKQAAENLTKDQFDELFKNARYPVPVSDS